ncbi:MAG TPA: hypothetical protein VFV38_14200 [Ktedonobacteraceae bacterium]|nr:hypothetical protein [Ktedonobacteraceae bacterium]
MSTAPPLLLTREQASRLQAYLQTYRRYAFAALLPGADRNTTLRVLQTMQGKLIDVIDQKTAPFRLVLTMEERTTLKAITAELLSLYAQESASEERNAILADLAALRASLKDG